MEWKYLLLILLVADCSAQRLELVFLMNAASSSAGNSTAWQLMITFVGSVTDALAQTPSRFAFVRAENFADATITLDTYTNSIFLKQAISQFPFIGGDSTNLPAAVDYLRAHIFADGVVRKGSSKVAVLVTNVLRTSDALFAAIDAAKQSGIKIVVVGVTGQRLINVDTMYKISTENAVVADLPDYSQLAQPNITGRQTNALWQTLQFICQDTVPTWHTTITTSMQPPVAAVCPGLNTVLIM